MPIWSKAFRRLFHGSSSSLSCRLPRNSQSFCGACITTISVTNNNVLISVAGNRSFILSELWIMNDLRNDQRTVLSMVMKNDQMSIVATHASFL